jgi:hypothetical protein
MFKVFDDRKHADDSFGRHTNSRHGQEGNCMYHSVITRLEIDRAQCPRMSELAQIIEGEPFVDAMCDRSFMTQLWRGNQVRTPRALDTASRRRIKLQELVLLRIDFQTMGAVSVVIQQWRGSIVRTSRALDRLLSRVVVSSYKSSSFLGFTFTGWV